MSVAENYQKLLKTIQYEPESHQTEVLGAEIAAAVARGEARTVDTATRQDKIHKLGNTVLGWFGMAVMFIPFESQEKAWVVIRPQQETDDFEGTQVLERASLVTA
ncbi:MAG: hypothetical protein AAF708_00090 [Deinococcota bacterium]